MKLLTPDEVAEQLRVSRRVVVESALRTQLPWLKLGRALRMRQEDLDQFIADATKNSLQKLPSPASPPAPSRAPDPQPPREPSTPRRKGGSGPYRANPY